MTAEIAILNKESIALAADSAVTIGEGNKIYNSANKLFSLSKFHPVGLMIYGSATFMNIPWETVVKSFRQYNYDKCYDGVEDYAKIFVAFLEKNELGISKKHQSLYVKNIASSYYKLIFDDVQKN